MDNANSREYLDKIRSQVIENLRRTTFAPSVQMTDVPRDSMAINDEDEAELDDLDDDQNQDKRNTQHRFNKYIEKPGELSDSEDEEMNEANGVRKQPGSPKRRNRLDYRNLNEWNGDSAITSGAVTPQAASSIPDNDGDEDVNVGDAEPTEKTEQGTESTVDAANGVAAAFEAPSPKAPDDEEEDVAMQDAGDEARPTIPLAAAAPATAPPALIPQQGVTPPDSPPNVPGIATPTSSPEAEPSASTTAADPAIKNEMAAEDAAVTAQAEGLTEREEENAKAEAAAEEASKIS